MRIWNVDDPQVTSRVCLPDGDPCAFVTSAIFTGASQNLGNFAFCHRVLVDVRPSGLWIYIESYASPHNRILSRGLDACKLSPSTCAPPILYGNLKCIF